MNKVYLIGNLTRDVDLAETPSGVAVAKFAIAVNRKFSDANGNKVTDFFNVVVWQGQAENCGKFLKKGDKVALVGELQNRSYEDREGIKRNITEVVANEVEFLSTKANDQEKDKSQEKPVVTMVEVTGEEADGLPF